jgi:hypothetical protein
VAAVCMHRRFWSRCDLMFDVTAVLLA